MAAGCHGNTGSRCCGNRLFMILPNEIAGNTSLQLSRSVVSVWETEEGRGGGWVGECNIGLIGVCIYSLCERAESERKVGCKGKLTHEGCCEQTGRDVHLSVNLYSWISAFGPLPIAHNKSIKCKYLSLLRPSHSLWEWLCRDTMLLNPAGASWDAHVDV